MNFEFSPEEQAFRRQVHEFFATEEATRGMAAEIESGAGFGRFTFEILEKLGARGWLCPTWPREYGGLELPEIYRYIVMDEMDYFTDRGTLVGAGMAGPIVLRQGSAEQKKEYLPRIAAGQIEFALGYTEPQAGSDVSSIMISAVDEGDHFVLNGQKVFNTDCHFAQYHWLGARTAATTPKYRGLSLFIVDLKTPGITIRPIWTMDGLRSNEVFYDAVKVPRACLVGEKNRGFYYILDALARERSYTTGSLRRKFEAVVAFVKETGQDNDAVVRRKIGELATAVEATRLLALRIPWLLDSGKTLNHEPAILKIFISELRQRMADFALQLFGPYGQLRARSRWAPLDGKLEWEYRDSVRRLITGGTTEIMRNVVAQRGLGLPRGT